MEACFRSVRPSASVALSDSNREPEQAQTPRLNESIKGVEPNKCGTRFRA